MANPGLSRYKNELIFNKGEQKLVQKKEIAVFIDRITRERATGDLLIVGWAVDEVTKEIPIIKVDKDKVSAEVTNVGR